MKVTPRMCDNRDEYLRDTWGKTVEPRTSDRVEGEAVIPTK